MRMFLFLLLISNLLYADNVLIPTFSGQYEVERTDDNPMTVDVDIQYGVTYNLLSDMKMSILTISNTNNDGFTLSNGSVHVEMIINF